jgi:hypothetical protein
MGRPSDKRRSAQRPGRLERARVKNRTKCCGRMWSSVGGVGTYEVKAGRKKYHKVVAHCERVMKSHQAGDSVTSKSGSEIKRPLYTISLRPLHSANEKYEIY